MAKMSDEDIDPLKDLPEEIKVKFQEVISQYERFLTIEIEKYNKSIDEIEQKYLTNNKKIIDAKTIAKENEHYISEIEVTTNNLLSAIFGPTVKGE